MITDARSKLISTSADQLITENDAARIEKIKAMNVPISKDDLTRLDLNGDGKITGMIDKVNAETGETERVVDPEEDAVKAYREAVKNGDPNAYKLLSDVHVYLLHYLEKLQAAADSKSAAAGGASQGETQPATAGGAGAKSALSTLLTQADVNKDGLISDADLRMIHHTEEQITTGDEISIRDAAQADIDHNGDFSLRDLDLMKFAMTNAADTNGDKVIDDRDVALAENTWSKIIDAKAIDADIKRVDSFASTLTTTPDILTETIQGSGKQWLLLKDDSNPANVVNLVLTYWSDGTDHFSDGMNNYDVLSGSVNIWDGTYTDGAKTIKKYRTYTVHDDGSGYKSLRIGAKQVSSSDRDTSYKQAIKLLGLDGKYHLYSYYVSTSGTSFVVDFTDGVHTYKSYLQTQTVEIDGHFYFITKDANNVITLAEQLQMDDTKTTQFNDLLDAYGSRLGSLTDLQDKQRAAQKEIFTDAVDTVLNPDHLVDPVAKANAQVANLKTMADVLNIKPPAVEPVVNEQTQQAQTLSELFDFVQFDLDGNGTVDATEYGIAKKTIDQLMKFTSVSDEELTKADVNQDGVINQFDKTVLQNSIGRYIDINGDRKVDATDMARLQEWQKYFSYQITSDELAKADITGANGIPDGDVTQLDYEALTKVLNDTGDLSWKKIDYNGDGKATQEDVDSITQAVNLIQAGFFNKQTKTIEKKDLNKDGLVNDKDVELLQAAFDAYQNVDEDALGAVDQADYQFILDMIKWSSIKPPTAEELKLADITGGPDGKPDGDVTMADLLLLKNSLGQARDVNGDGKINEKDLQTVSEVKDLVNLQSLVLSKYAEKSNPLFDMALEIEGHILYVSRPTANEPRWKINDGHADNYSFVEPGDTNVRIKVAGVTYNILVDPVTHAVTLKKIKAESVRVADGVIAMGQNKYRVVKQDDGSYQFVDTVTGKIYTGQKGIGATGGMVLIDGVAYDIAVDPSTQRVTLSRSFLSEYESISEPEFVIELNGQPYRVSRRVATTGGKTSTIDYFVFDDGSHRYSNVYGSNIVEIQGVKYQILVDDAKGEFKLRELLAADINQDGTLSNLDQSLLTDAKTMTAVRLNAATDLSEYVVIDGVRYTVNKDEATGKITLKEQVDRSISADFVMIHGAYYRIAYEPVTSSADGQAFRSYVFTFTPYLVSDSGALIPVSEDGLGNYDFQVNLDELLKAKGNGQYFTFPDGLSYKWDDLLNKFQINPAAYPAPSVTSYGQVLRAGTKFYNVTAVNGGYVFSNGADAVVSQTGKVTLDGVQYAIVEGMAGIQTHNPEVNISLVEYKTGLKVSSQIFTTNTNELGKVNLWDGSSEVEFTVRKCSDNDVTGCSIGLYEFKKANGVKYFSVSPTMLAIPAGSDRYSVYYIEQPVQSGPVNLTRLTSLEGISASDLAKQDLGLGNDTGNYCAGIDASKCGFTGDKPEFHEPRG